MTWGREERVGDHALDRPALTDPVAKSLGMYHTGVRSAFPSPNGRTLVSSYRKKTMGKAGVTGPHATSYASPQLKGSQPGPSPVTAERIRAGGSHKAMEGGTRATPVRPRASGDNSLPRQVAHAEQRC